MIESYYTVTNMKNHSPDFLRVRLPGALIVLATFIILPSASYDGFADAPQITKLIVLLYALVLLLAIALIRVVSLVKVTVAISRIDTILFLLLLYLLLNRFLFHADHSISMQVYELLGLAVCYLLVRCFPVKVFLYFLVAIVLGGTVQSAHGVLQLLGMMPVTNEHFIITGSFFNPGPYAGYLALTAVLATGMYLFRTELISHYNIQYEVSKPSLAPTIKKAIFAYVPLSCLALGIILLPALRSRAAWIAFAIGCLYLVVYKYRWHGFLSQLTIAKKILLIAGILITGAVGLYGIYTFKAASADGRFVIYQVCADMIQQHPVFGLGFDRFQAHYMDAQANWLKNEGGSAAHLLADNTYYAFNEPLQFMVENGLPGLLIAGFLVFSCIRLKTAENDHLLKLFAIAALTAVLGFGLFSYPSYILPIKLIAVVMLCLLARIDSSPLYKNELLATKVKKITAMKLGAVIFCLALLAGTIRIAEQLRTGFTGWRMAQRDYNYEGYQQSVAGFSAVYGDLKDHGDFTMQYGKALAMAGKYKEAIDVLNRSRHHLNTTITQTTLGDCYTALGQYAAAEQAYQKAADMTPGRFYPLYLLIRLYDTSGQQQKAYLLAKTIMAKQVKVPSKAISEIKTAVKAILVKYETGKIRMVK
jgi:O-antigen ligase